MRRCAQGKLENGDFEMSPGKRIGPKLGGKSGAFRFAEACAGFVLTSTLGHGAISQSPFAVGKPGLSSPVAFAIVYVRFLVPERDWPRLGLQTSSNVRVGHDSEPTPFLVRGPPSELPSHRSRKPVTEWTRK